MIKLLKICMIITFGLIIVGCAVKETDSTSIKVAKHVTNSPAYIVLTANTIANVIGGTIGLTVSEALVDSNSSIKLYSGEEYIGIIKEELLDNNSSLAKFYTDDDFSLYKNQENHNFILLKSSGNLIKYSNPTLEQRWSASRRKGKPFLYIYKYSLPKDISKEAITLKMKKDKFGNSIALGDSTVLKIDQHRAGLFLTLHTSIYIIEGGARTIDVIDENAPISVREQIKYYFPEN